MDNFVSELFLLFHWILLLWFLTKFPNNSIDFFLVHVTNNSISKFPNFKYPILKKKLKKKSLGLFVAISNLFYLKKGRMDLYA